jgi:adenylate kinase
MTTTNKLHRLNVTFLSVLKSKSGRVISRRETDSTYFFEGRTKKECIDKAKRANRYSSFYAKTWEMVDA